MAATDPVVIAHDVHVTYKTYGGKRNALRAPQENMLARLMGRASEHVGAVNEVHAVRGVSFVAHEGESVGLIGRNGSGKSTLLRAIAGLVPTSSGAIYARGDVSLLGVNAALMSGLSGTRNIILGGLAQGMTRQEIRERREEIIEFAGIGEFVHLPMRAYSSGMAARLRFAISSATTPDILIIDEALATGDAEFKEKSAERVEQIREEAGTVFIVSHSLVSITSMCTRAIWLEQGEVRADGEPEEIVDMYQAFVKERRAKGRR
jgi:teichoic acid transport system ATP-binding protein